MSGVSRFLEQPSPWRYSKAEDLPTADLRQFNYVLAAPGKQIPGFALAHVQEGFKGVSLQPPFLLYEPKIHVLRRQQESTGTASQGRAKGAFDDF